MSSPRRLQETYLPSRKSRILIACEDDSIAEQLRLIFLTANFKSEHTKDIRTACKFIESGRFQVVFTFPLLCDGSWQQLFDFARSRELPLFFVVMARSFDFHDWGESLRNGAINVLDVLKELPKPAEVPSQAFWTAISNVPHCSSQRSNLRDHHDRLAFNRHNALVRTHQRRIGREQACKN